MRAALFFVATLLLSSAASAINQPGGAQIPVGTQLQTIFSGRSETISVRDDAAIVPERFVPGCTLTFTLVTRGDAAFRDVFGWYNVRPGVTPSPENPPRDLHVLIPCDATAGQRFTLNLRGNPDYLGGEIGFFLRTPEDGHLGTCTGDCCASLSRVGSTFFSERAYNPDNTTGAATSYIHLLTYDSRVTAHAFYFAWEDLFSGGDNNFTDFVALVDEIVCTGGGGSCDTTMSGACGAGTLQCRAGALVCTSTVSSVPERCDGVDNNCNGAVDEGDGLCGAMQVCDRGRCVDRCLSELGCFPGLLCTDRGTCVDAACATVTCGDSQRCEAGHCVGACEGITCPAPTACRAGRCVDPCADVTCDSDQACVAGVCVPRCECRGCAAGQTCAADGRCRATACAAVSCASGTTCVAGACVDACTGAVCPTGERCAAGACVPIPVPDGGVPRDATPLSDVGFFDLGAPDVQPAAVDAGTTADAPADTGTPTFNVPRDGCSCGVETRAFGGGRGVLLAGLLAVWAARRQRFGAKRSRRRLP